MWLVFNDKTLTWELLQKRGYKGPGRCSLCLRNTDGTHHLFCDCSYFDNLWLLITNYLKIAHSWKKAFVRVNLHVWKQKKFAYEYLPFFIFWEVWKARNVSLFTNYFQRVEVTYAKTLSSMLEWHR